MLPDPGELRLELHDAAPQLLFMTTFRSPRFVHSTRSNKMKSYVLPALAGVALGMCAVDSVPAHGGQYRGPGDIVPPGGYGHGGRPTGPYGRAKRGPITPGGRGSATGGRAATTPGSIPFGGIGRSTPRTGGINITDDLSRWVYWWEFNKAPYIRLREALNAARPTSGGDVFYMGSGRMDRSVDQIRPTQSDIRDRVVPRLLAALEATNDRDITSACMVALAKIGMDSDGSRLLPLYREHLKSRDQEIRESAALCMGISQLPGATSDLVAIVTDNARGRALVDRSPVDQRTRAFAAYGLGLIAHGSNNIGVKRVVFDALRSIVEDDRAPGFNLKVAAIQGMRQLNVGTQPSDAAKILLGECTDTLGAYYQRDLGSGEQLVQAHVPTAIATLLGRSGARSDRFKQLFASDLASTGTRRDVLRQSAALALGDMARPEEQHEADAPYSQALLRYYTDGKNRQARYFSLMALAQIGGNHNRVELLKILTRAKHLDRPWAALALGVLSFHAIEHDASPADVATVGRALQTAMKREASPENRASLAIALGLCRYRDAAPDLRELLRTNSHQDELAGYICIGLALMNDTEATDQIGKLVRTSVRRPERLKQSAIALGKLGHFGVSDTLRKQLGDGDKNVAKLSAISTALGFIGDRRTLAPLADALFDEDLTELSRAFAAVALGSIGDLNDLPWNSKFSNDLNYRAAVETLTNRVSGILDIL